MSRGDATNGVAQVERLLRAHAFRELFIEELGWDRLGIAARVAHRGAEYLLSPIAHKRGLAVYECSLDRLELRDRRVLRGIQQGLRQYSLENVLIVTDRDGTTQVWQWAMQREEGQSILNREHPFRSRRPPPEFVQRLLSLRVALDEEEQVSLLDVSRETARTFNRAPDLPVFFRNPRYLYESEQLASQLATGGTAALHRFIELHDALARWIARRYEYTSVELEDLEQMARIGLIRAAQRFEPQRGFAFSTYAFYWIRQYCQRHLQSYLFHGGLRPDLFWRSLKIIRRFRRHSGAADGRLRARLVDRLEGDEVIGPWAERVLRIWETEHLYQRPDVERAAFRVPDSACGLMEQLARRDDLRVLHDAIESLDDRSAYIVRRRFGLDDEREFTLEEVAQELGLTRERVRQVQENALSQIERRLGAYVARGAMASVASTTAKPKRESEQK